MSNTICYGDTTILKPGTVAPTYSYAWFRNGVYFKNADSIVLTELTDTRHYTLKLTNDINGVECSSMSDSVQVTITPAPLPPDIILSDSVICANNSVELSTHSGATEYIWWINNTSEKTESPKYSTLRLYEGDYDVKLAIKKNNCASGFSDIKTISVLSSPDIPDIETNIAPDFCEGEKLTITIKKFNPTLTYQWFKNTEFIDKETSSSIDVDSSGNYFVKVSNNICSINSDTIVATKNSIPPIPNLVMNTGVVCPGSESEFSIANYNPTNHYRWKRYGEYFSANVTDNFKLSLSEGSYSVEAWVGNCRSASNSITLKHKQTLEKPTLYAKGPNYWYLAASNDSAKYYRWFYNGKELQNANKYVYVAKQNYGKYRVEISENDDCYTSSDSVMIWAPINKSGEMSPLGTIKVYPNPTPGLFTIEMDNELYGELKIDIDRSNGSNALRLKFLKNHTYLSTQVDLSGQGEGLYLLYFRLNEQGTVRKLIVE
ncbi:T9SS type A sorting domain-containing protein [Bacteroidales bacterium]|nr:T9SS type A sorting domain-containing protein [Bacteroidales bacterium]